MALGLLVEPGNRNALDFPLKNGQHMTQVHIAHPLQASVIGLLVEVFASPDVLEKVSKPIAEDKAQALAALIANDMRDSLNAKYVSTIIGAGLLDETALNDEELDIIVALEHVSEQHVAANRGVYSAALTMTNNGLDSICFPQLAPSNEYEVSYLSYCLPISIVGGTGALDAFEENFYQENREHLHFADERIVDALLEAYGLAPGELKVIGYEDLEDASEALGAFSTNAKLIEIGRAQENGRQAFYLLKLVPVFVTQNQVRVAFLTFDVFARRMPQLETVRELEEEYFNFQRDFRFVVDILTSEGLSPIIISYPSATGTVSWEEVVKAKRQQDLMIEEAHRALPMTDDGEATTLDVICMTNPDDHVLVAATISKLNEDGAIMAQTNVYPLSVDAMELVLEYAKAIAQREGLELEVTEGDNLYVNNELRALSAPPYTHTSTKDLVPARTLH
jgi:hypothetical protein